MRYSWSIFIYTQARAWAFQLSSRLLPRLLLGGLTSLVGGLDPLACWFCMSPTGMKAPIVMGGAPQLDSASSLYEFIDLSRISWK